MIGRVTGLWRLFRMLVRHARHLRLWSKRVVIMPLWIFWTTAAISMLGRP
jgi:hypothetical protein